LPVHGPIGGFHEGVDGRLAGRVGDAPRDRRQAMTHPEGATRDPLGKAPDDPSSRQDRRIGEEERG